MIAEEILIHKIHLSFLKELKTSKRSELCYFSRLDSIQKFETYKLDDYDCSMIEKTFDPKKLYELLIYDY
jgi:hypothetical protein